MAPNVQHFIRELDLHTGKLYDTQRTAILERLRAKWPTRSDLKKTDQDRLEVTQWIKPLVFGFLSEKNLQPHEVDHRLATYTEWAYRLNDWSRDEMRRSARLSDLEADKTHESEENMLKASSDATQNRSTQYSIQPSIRTLQDEVDMSMTSGSTPHAVITTSQATIWDDVELAIDATALGLGVIWLPLLQLKPVKSKACHWSDFTFTRFISTLEEETGTKIDTAVCEFVYGDIIFTNPGAWNIVLKRFGESAHGQRSTLRLTIQLKAQPRLANETQEREVEVASTSSDSRERRSKRARSRFEGLLSDYSEDNEETNKEQLPEWELPPPSVKRLRLSGEPGHQG